ncbi:NF-kappa-B inhibitor zeta [Genypterus blacodes]|uniref:NF-kappa-B inhibitor zeta n=1 Tax=Genypterus blacodes TaxID=154954 RepID=UPI003F75DD59
MMLESCADRSLPWDENTAGCRHSTHSRTVRDLLALKRSISRSKQWKPTQEDDSTAGGFGSVSPTVPSSPVLPPAAPQPQPVLHPTLQVLAATAEEAKMTLFGWQVQKEAARVEGLSSELLNMQDEDGDTCLHIAVAQGRRALAYVLAGKMAQMGSLSIREHNGQTALQVAVASNQYLILHDLLALGAQINTCDLWGRSPLHVCAEQGSYLSLQSIQMFLTATGQAVDIDTYNYDGFTPLHAAILSHNKVVKELRGIKNCCSVMEAEFGQRKQMYVECIRTLLLLGASCGTKDMKSGRTSLHMAAEEANTELLRLLLRQPPSLSLVNLKTFSGNTALHLVCALQNHSAQVESVKLLMRRGADAGAKNGDRELPSHLVPAGFIGEKVRLILKGTRLHA